MKRHLALSLGAATLWWTTTAIGQEPEWRPVIRDAADPDLVWVADEEPQPAAATDAHSETPSMAGIPIGPTSVWQTVRGNDDTDEDTRPQRLPDGPPEPPGEDKPAPKDTVTPVIINRNEQSGTTSVNPEFSVAPDHALIPSEPDDLVAQRRAWIRGEYLFWAVKGDTAPPLATTGPPESFGILGQPGTRILLGGNQLDDSWQNGARFFAGCYLDECGEFGVEVGGFFLGPDHDNFTFASGAFPVLARPIFAPNFPAEFAELVAFPGIARGRLDIERDFFLWGAEANASCLLCCGCGYALDLFGGFRYLDLNESLSITELIVLNQARPIEKPPFVAPPGTRVRVNDTFETRNQFYGGQIGGRAEFVRDRWSLNVRAACALGVTHQTLAISGSQLFLPPGGRPIPFAGGLLALPSNIGVFHRDRFSVVPEVTFTVGYQVTEQLRAFVGYNFLYWTNVIRPGESIDRVVNVTRVPNNFLPIPPSSINRPVPIFRDTDFWAQGVNLGLEYRW